MTRSTLPMPLPVDGEGLGVGFFEFQHLDAFANAEEIGDEVVHTITYSSIGAAYLDQVLPSMHSKNCVDEDLGIVLAIVPFRLG